MPFPHPFIGGFKGKCEYTVGGFSTLSSLDDDHNPTTFSVANDTNIHKTFEGDANHEYSDFNYDGIARYRITVLTSPTITVQALNIASTRRINIINCGIGPYATNNYQSFRNDFFPGFNQDGSANSTGKFLLYSNQDEDNVQQASVGDFFDVFMEEDLSSVTGASRMGLKVVCGFNNISFTGSLGNFVLEVKRLS